MEIIEQFVKFGYVFTIEFNNNMYSACVRHPNMTALPEAPKNLYFIKRRGMSMIAAMNALGNALKDYRHQIF